MSDWTQAVCIDDWERRNPGRIPRRLVEQYRETEICCYCGVETRSGIYVRVDPETVPYPTRERDE